MSVILAGGREGLGSSSFGRDDASSGGTRVSIRSDPRYGCHVVSSVFSKSHATACLWCESRGVR